MRLQGGGALVLGLMLLLIASHLSHVIEGFDTGTNSEDGLTSPVLSQSVDSANTWDSLETPTSYSNTPILDEDATTAAAPSPAPPKGKASVRNRRRPSCRLQGRPSSIRVFP